ncbi:ArsR family transcriptional regulator [Rhodococcus sp. KBW08]|uniref:ArsR/SmtB family transcription factor n=1 Tax=Rhodococcus sp. KBW08 TaxID=2144188 RepID=UPI000F5A87A7|nr:metalloregulator ArsR/SmtB family transcription factor [Rhodococcus sp. KBW08]RQO46099.1 ArsR family transcriptional regulator [Rhodococcus sp. KBW08]
MAHSSAPTPDELVDVLKALADPVRMDLLRRIAAVDEIACTDLVEESHVSASTVSYHVKTLRTAGLVQVRKDGRNFHYTYRPEVVTTLATELNRLG